MASLHTAVEAGDLQSVQFLVAAGADKEEMQDVRDDNHQKHNKATPLYRASYKGQIAVAKFLVESGANLEAAASSAGGTALYAAAGQGHLSVVRMLIEYGANKEALGFCRWSPLTAASRWGHVAVVKYLLEQGCDVNHIGAEGWSSLHAAAANGSLFSRGAALDLRDFDGYTPSDIFVNRRETPFSNAIRTEWNRRRDLGL